MTLKSLILTALSFLSLTHPALGQSPELRQFEVMWQRGEYEAVLKKLADYRDTARYRSAGLDYMIATSACRTRGKQRDANRYFNWILKNYVLNKDDRKVIEDERRTCSQRTVPARPPILTTPTQFGALFYLDKPGPYTKANTGRSSGAIESHKVYGESDPETDELHGEPVPVPLEKITRRLIKPSERHLAMQRVKDGLRGMEQIINKNYFGTYRFKIEATEHFILASVSNHSKAKLAKIGQDLETYLKFYMSQYGMLAPPYLITVYLVPSEYMLSDFATEMHGISVQWMATIGYSFPVDQSITALILRMIYGTLKHELFHLMVRNDFGDIPPWLEEGMATLYEASRITPEGIIGVPSWRARALRDPRNRWPHIRELVAMDWRAFITDIVEEEGFYGDEEKLIEGEEFHIGSSQEVNHSVARYFALYLQEKQKLKDVYDAFRQRSVVDDPDEQAAKIIESILQQPLDALNADFVKWFKQIDGQRQILGRRKREGRR